MSNVILKRPIILIGMPGCGKSHTGKLLADYLSLPFIDLDVVMERYAQKKLAQVFKELGEEGFRQFEQQQLHHLLHQQDIAVIASGGGTPCFFDNMAVINKHGLSVYLQVPVETLALRLSSQAQTRPLLKSIAKNELEVFLTELIVKREPYYLQAHLTLPPVVINDIEFMWDVIKEHL